jgi:hypothetical protein
MKVKMNHILGFIGSVFSRYQLLFPLRQGIKILRQSGVENKEAPPDRYYMTRPEKDRGRMTHSRFLKTRSTFIVIHSSH